MTTPRDPAQLGYRLGAVAIFAAIAFTLLAAQLVRMQVFRAEHYRQVAQEQMIRALPVEPPRGVITDRNGVVLARNKPAFSVQVIPGELPRNEERRRAVLLQLERETGTSFAEIEAGVRAGAESVDPFAPVEVRAGLDNERAIVARAAFADVTGVRVVAAPVRVYEQGDLLPHILGYTGPISPEQVAGLRDLGYPLDARVGQAGIESVYERALRGTEGKLLVSADPAGREIARLGNIDAVPGADVMLSIDLGLQRAATDALREGIAKGLPASGLDSDGKPAAQAGAAVVLDVRSGEVLALVTLPSYDANIFSGTQNRSEIARLLQDPGRPLLNRAYMEVKAPGSIFKPIVGLAALQEKIATTSTRITSTGAITIVNQYDPSVLYVFRDWAAHGTLDFNRGMARSSDVYFYYLAGGFEPERFEGLGAERVSRYARAFGLGAPTGIDLPGEASGLVPSAEWKEKQVGEPWVLGDTYTYGIGQGYLTTTPLQMAVAAAALANGGEVLVPRVVTATRTAKGMTRVEKLVRGRLPAEPQYIEAVRASMLATAGKDGTAFEGKPEGISIGAKTGTAEFGTMRKDGSYDAHGWFMAFGPYEQPEVAVVVYLEHGVGATHAGPVARKILEAYFGTRGAQTTANLGGAR